jgi:hypothetical protein
MACCHCHSRSSTPELPPRVVHETALETANGPTKEPDDKAESNANDIKVLSPRPTEAIIGVNPTKPTFFHRVLSKSLRCKPEALLDSHSNAHVESSAIAASETTIVASPRGWDTLPCLDLGIFLPISEFSPVDLSAHRSRNASRGTTQDGGRGSTPNSPHSPRYAWIGSQLGHSQSCSNIPPLPSMSQSARIPSFSATSNSRKWQASVLEPFQISMPSWHSLNSDISQTRQVGSFPDCEPFPSFEIGLMAPSLSPIRLGAVDSKFGSSSNTYEGRKSHDGSVSPPRSFHLTRAGVRHFLAPSGDTLSGSITPPARHCRTRRFSSGGEFGSEDVPDNWGRVLPSRTQVSASSEYSSRQPSPSMSRTDLPPLQQYRSLDAAVNQGGQPSSSANNAIQDGTHPYLVHRRVAANIPTNPSTSSLGKESRFREELDISAPSSSRRNSMLNFIGLGSKAHTSGEHLRMSDGSSDDRFDQKGNTNVKVELNKRTKTFISIRKPTTMRRPDVTPHEPPVSLQVPVVIQTTDENDHQQSEVIVTGTSEASQTARRAALKIADRTRQLSSRTDAIGMMAKAIKATEAERSAFLLPEHKDQALQPSVRLRSSSVYRIRRSVSAQESVLPEPSMANVTRSRSETLLSPAFNIPSFGESYTEGPSRQRLLSVAVDPADKDHLQVPRTSISVHVNPSPELTRGASIESKRNRPIASPVSSQLSRHSKVGKFEYTATPLGAWSRYPSHTRGVRSGSAGTADHIITKDFALITPALITDSTGSMDEAGPSTLSRTSSFKRKVRLGSPSGTKMGKAREIFKHYGRFFQTNSLEYLRYGHGHRTSVSTGGQLENPDLELLPPVWSPPPVMEKDAQATGRAVIDSLDTSEPLTVSRKLFRGNGKERVGSTTSFSKKEARALRELELELSRSTDGSPCPSPKDRSGILRPWSASSSDVYHTLDSSSIDNAIMWSRYYESCSALPSSNLTDHIGSNNTTSPKQHKDSMFSEPDSSDQLQPKSTTSSRIGSGSSSRIRAMGSSADRRRHSSMHIRNDHKDSSQTSFFRQSSYDLYRLILQREEEERQKAMGLSAERLESSGVVEVVTGH